MTQKNADFRKIMDLLNTKNTADDNLVPKELINKILYLKATTIEVGYLLNFGKKPQFSRKVFSNNRK